LLIGQWYRIRIPGNSFFFSSFSSSEGISKSSVIYPTIEEFNEYLSVLDLSITPIPREALFLAGKAFLK